MTSPEPVQYPDAAEIRRRFGVVLERIVSAGGQVDGPDRITVVAVTKTFPQAVVDAAVEAGIRDLGENYAQELVAKATTTPESVRWHFIGGLQTNKVRKLVPFVSLWHTLDRDSLAIELSKRAPTAKVLVQLNTTGEQSKSGVDPGEAEALVRLAWDLGLEVMGLMTIGPTDLSIDPRPKFALCRSMADDLGLKVVSMGMSGDLEAAVEEGSTMVRIGSALFGHRHTR